MSVSFRRVISCMGVRIWARWVPGGQVAMLRPNVGKATTPVLADCEAVYTYVETWLDAVYKDLISQNWNIFRLQVFSLEDEFGPIQDNLLSINGTMSASGVDEADWAPETLLGSGLMGYGEHGRIYNLAPDNSALGVNSYTAAHLAAVTIAWETLHAALNGDEDLYWLAIARPTSGNARRVESFAYSTLFTKQTRRRQRPTT